MPVQTEPGAESTEELLSVGAATPESVRLFVRSPIDGVVRWRGIDGTDRIAGEARHAPPAADDGTAAVTVDGLAPDTAYALEVVLPSGRREVVRARTPARRDAPPKRVAIAVASCHQPFDDDGTVHSKVAPMCEGTDALLDALDVSALFLVGDQVYADLPRALSPFDSEVFARVGPPGRASLFDCTRAEVRQIYQAQSRRWLGVGPFHALTRHRPTYMVLDDHEVVDNFGTDPAHREHRWWALREGALDAAFDYQARRALDPTADGGRPPCFDFTYRNGCLALRAVDLRSQRRVVDGQVMPFDDAQLASLRRFFEEHEDAAVACVVLSVPLVHVPAWMANVGAFFEGDGGNAADRWSHAGHDRARAAIVRVLQEAQRARPERRIVLLGGDVHVGAVHRIEWDEPGLAPTWQLTSSALTNRENRFFQLLAEVGAALPESVRLPKGEPEGRVLLARGAEDAHTNPFGGLNVGVLELLPEAAGLGLRLSLYGLVDGEVARVYDSGIV